MHRPGSPKYCAISGCMNMFLVRRPIVLCVFSRVIFSGSSFRPGSSFVTRYYVVACSAPALSTSDLMAARRRKGRTTKKDQSASNERANQNGKARMSKHNNNSASARAQSSGLRYPMIFAVIMIPILSVLLLKQVVRDGDTGGDDSVEKRKLDQQESSNKSPSHVMKSIFVGEKYEVLNTFDHDPAAFTQGLTYYGGKLYEGTGLNGKSELRELQATSTRDDATTGSNIGSVLRSRKMDNKYFGEGIAHYHDANGNERIIQLTWKERTGFIYDAQTFDVVKEFKYETHTNEGWGIAYNAREKEFIVSDGSDWIFFWDRDTLKEKRRIQVTIPQISNVVDAEGHNEQRLSRNPVTYLNELEMVNGLLLANIWYQNVLIAIGPKDGNVVRVYDFTNLYKDRAPAADCFNGISVTDVKDELFVTGKNWPYMYRIKLL